MAKNKKEKESYKRYQKFLEMRCNLMAEEKNRKLTIPESWSKTAIKMGYNQELTEHFSDYVDKNFINDDKSMIFFKILDVADKNYKELLDARIVA